MAARQAFVATQTETLWTQSAYGSASKVWRLLLQSIVLGVGAWLAIDRQISPGAFNRVSPTDCGAMYQKQLPIC